MEFVFPFAHYYKGSRFLRWWYIRWIFQEEKETDDAEENEVETKKMHQMVVKTVEEEEEEYFVGEVRLAKHTLSISSYQILLHPLSIAFNSGSYSAFNPADSISCH